MFSKVSEFVKLLESGSLTLGEIISIRRQLKSPFRYHPLGFISCVLLSEGKSRIRLHYWPLDGGQLQSPYCQIHDHLFDFKSWIFAGNLQNIEYKVGPAGKEMSEYRADYVGNKSILLKTGIRKQLEEVGRSTYASGSSYSLSAGLLHETLRVSIEPAFTVVYTTEKENLHPLVFGPVDGEDRYEYSREIVDDEIVDRLFDAIQIS